MLAVSGEPFDSDEFQFEIKWDGTRCVAIRSDDLRLQNRRRFEMRERYPELACLTELAPGTIIDGEIVVLEGGKPSFQKLQQREHQQTAHKVEMLAERLPATLMAFDLLYDAGASMLKAPVTERRARLAEIVASVGSAHVLCPDAIVGRGVDYFRAVEAEGLEGLIAKRLDSTYQLGVRSPDWIKIKVAQEAVYEVIGFTQKDNLDHVAALIVGERHGSRWTYKSKVGTGFTDAQRAELLVALRGLPELEKPPTDGPKEGQWRATGLRCLVRFMEKTPTGKLRAPVFVGFVE